MIILQYMIGRTMYYIAEENICKILQYQYIVASLILTRFFTSLCGLFYLFYFICDSITSAAQYKCQYPG